MLASLHILGSVKQHVGDVVAAPAVWRLSSTLWHLGQLTMKQACVAEQLYSYICPPLYEEGLRLCVCKHLVIPLGSLGEDNIPCQSTKDVFYQSSLAVCSMFVRSICLLAGCSEKCLFGQVFWRASGTNTVLLLPLHHHPQLQEKVVRTAKATRCYFHVLKLAISGIDSFLYCLTSCNNPFLELFIGQQISGQTDKPYVKKKFPLQGMPHWKRHLIEKCTYSLVLSSDGKKLSEVSVQNALMSVSWHCPLWISAVSTSKARVEQNWSPK